MSTPNSTEAELLKQIEALKAERSKILAEKRTEFDVRVSEKGAISVYGMGRFPVSLYPEQWSKVLSNASVILQFITANEGLITKRQMEAKVATALEKQSKKTS